MSLKEKVMELTGGGEILTAATVADLLDVSHREASNALAALARSGELARVGRGKYTAADEEHPPVAVVVELVEPEESEPELDEALVDEALREADRFIEFIADTFDLDPAKVALAFEFYFELVKAS